MDAGLSVWFGLLQFDATDDAEFLEIGRRNTVEKMAPHVSHVGVHDHGFNNVSTYGNLLRLMGEGRIAEDAWERRFYELALKLSGAIQARRWTEIPGGGYIYSFNGPHSLFVDTIRSLRGYRRRPGASTSCTTVRRPCGSFAVETTPTGLCKAKLTRGSGPSTRRPSTATRSSGPTARAGSRTTDPATLTRPAKISSSAPRREDTPA